MPTSVHIKHECSQSEHLRPPRTARSARPLDDQLHTNKVVAAAFPNDSDGNAFRMVFPPIAQAAGYTFNMSSAYPDGTTNYSSMISQFKSDNADFFTNVPLPPDFATMWKQSVQQGFRPKLATVAKVLLFPTDTYALGSLVYNVATDAWWAPSLPWDLAPGAGEVRFAGRTVTKLDAAARCRLGIGRTYQVPRPFGDMTVFENLLVAAQQGGGLRRRASYTAAVEALERTGMSGQANVAAERLGLLQRKRLELARALATQPTLLLLDEVAGGLTDPEVAQLVEIVRGVNAEGIAVIWIEHVVRALTAVVSRLICLTGGKFVGDGDPATVLADPAVREVFLGTEVTAALAGGSLETPPRVPPDGTAGAAGADRSEP